MRYRSTSRSDFSLLENILKFGTTSDWDKLPTAIATLPATHDPRNLANVPPEILQIVFRLVFEEAAVFCICRPTLGGRRHVTDGSWEMLLTCRRFYQEGLKIWHEAVVLYADCLLPDHLPKHMVEHCKQEAYEYSRPDSIPNDDEVLQMKDYANEAYVEWAQEVVACLPRLTVKFQKEIYINNIIDMYLICDLVIKKDETVVNRTLKRYVRDEDKVEELECLDECKELLAELGIDTAGTTWG